jgi:hypothetical protein
VSFRNFFYFMHFQIYWYKVIHNIHLSFLKSENSIVRVPLSSLSNIIFNQFDKRILILLILFKSHILVSPIFPSDSFLSVFCLFVLLYLRFFFLFFWDQIWNLVSGWPRTCYKPKLASNSQFPSHAFCFSFINFCFLPLYLLWPVHFTFIFYFVLNFLKQSKPFIWHYGF